MRPNVLILVVDALRLDRVGVFGGRELTPQVDEFADDAAVFPRAFTTTNATDPAVTSLQTGRYPLSHGVVHHGNQVTDEEKRAVEDVAQLPELLSREGYRTAKFGRPLGRWHRAGFDHYPEIGEQRRPFDPDDASLLRRAREKLALSGQRLQDGLSRALSRTSPRLVGRSASGSRGDSGGGSDLVEEFSAFAADSERPFYGFVHLMDTHTPYDVDHERVRACLERYEYENVPLADVAEEFPAGSFAHDRLTEGGHVHELVVEWADSEWGVGTAVLDAQYDAAVRTADERIGEILDTLRERDQLEDTIVFVLSDHGESLTEHGIYYDHHGLYDVSVRIPLVVRPPGGGGGSIDDFVQITDVAPTVASYVGLDGLDDVGGVDLLPSIQSDESVDREVVLAEEAHTQRRRMIRTRDEKLIYDLEDDVTCRYCEVVHAPATEYYSLKDSPVELIDCSDDHPERVAELRDRAAELANNYTERCPDPDGESAKYDDDEVALKDRLEALGYR